MSGVIGACPAHCNALVLPLSMSPQLPYCMRLDVISRGG